MDSVGIGEQPSTPLADLAGEDGLPGAIAIPVTVDGPVMTEERASTFGGISTETAVASGASNARQILRPDPRRRKALVIALTQDMRVGASQAAAESTGGVWPKGTPLPLTSRSELWASCATAGQTTDITVIVERWA